VAACLAFGVVGSAGGTELVGGDRPPEVVLDRGSIGVARYKASLHRAPGAGASGKPCIAVILGPRGSGENSRSTLCGSLAPAPGLVLSSSAGQGRQEKVVLAVAFQRSVTRVRLSVAGRQEITEPLALLSKEKAERAGMRRIRFGVFPYIGPFCLAHITAYDFRGRIIRDTDEATCPTSQRK
jgi:hypothetical protein